MVETILAMDNILPAYVTTKTSAGSPTLRWLNSGQFYTNIPQVIDMPADSNPWLPPNNITDTIAQLAETMTIVMRNTPDITNQLQMVQGTAWEQRTFVHVRWGWAVWPILLLALSLVFLISTVAKSSKEENVVRIWKNSIIAVLFNGLGEDVQNSVGPNARLSEARSKARGFCVKLVPE